MSKIDSKEDFIGMWNQMFKCKCKEEGSIVKIKETQSEGEGEIFLKFTIMDSSKQFVLQCDLSQGFSISYLQSSKKPDGLVFFVDLVKRVIQVYIVELKKTITRRLEDANKQINTLFYFIQSLSLEKCFDVRYYCVIGYQNCNKQSMAPKITPSNRNRFIAKLYSGFLESCKNKKGDMPILHPFCTFEIYDLYSVKFHETLEIES